LPLLLARTQRPDSSIQTIKIADYFSPLFALDLGQSASLGKTRKDDTFARDGDAASAGGGGGALLHPLSSGESANGTQEQGQKSNQ
jgi:hypothetical protein